MGHLSGHKKTKVVLWEHAGKTQHNEPKVSSGVEIKVRWVDRQEETLTPQNETIRTDVMITTSRDIPIGSILWKNSFNNLPSPVTNVTDLYQAVTRNATPDLKTRQTVYHYQLVRFGDNLPTVV